MCVWLVSMSSSKCSMPLMPASPPSSSSPSSSLTSAALSDVIDMDVCSALYDRLPVPFNSDDSDDTLLLFGKPSDKLLLDSVRVIGGLVVVCEAEDATSDGRLLNELAGERRGCGRCTDEWIGVDELSGVLGDKIDEESDADD